MTIVLVTELHLRVLSMRSLMKWMRESDAGEKERRSENYEMMLHMSLSEAPERVSCSVLR